MTMITLITPNIKAVSAIDKDNKSYSDIKVLRNSSKKSFDYCPIIKTVLSTIRLITEVSAELKPSCYLDKILSYSTLLTCKKRMDLENKNILSTPKILLNHIFINLQDQCKAHVTTTVTIEGTKHIFAINCILKNDIWSITNIEYI